MNKNKFDVINKPEHYNSSQARCECGKQIECIYITENMNFTLGNCIKYIWRAPFKGKPLEDLQKAAWYLNREIERLTKNEKTT